METVVDESKELESKEISFSEEIGFDLKNYLDKSILQTMMDAEKYNDEPFRIIKKPLFKANKSGKIIDDISVEYCSILSAIRKIKDLY